MKHRVPNSSRGIKRHAWGRIAQGEQARQLLFRNRGARFLDYLRYIETQKELVAEKMKRAA